MTRKERGDEGSKEGQRRRKSKAYLTLYFFQGVIWNVNPYDQWGVELGKKLVKCWTFTLRFSSREHTGVEDFTRVGGRSGGELARRFDQRPHQLDQEAANEQVSGDGQLLGDSERGEGAEANPPLGRQGGGKTYVSRESSSFERLQGKQISGREKSLTCGNVYAAVRLLAAPLGEHRDLLGHEEQAVPASTADRSSCLQGARYPPSSITSDGNQSLNLAESAVAGRRQLRLPEEVRESSERKRRQRRHESRQLGGMREKREKIRMFKWRQAARLGSRRAVGAGNTPPLNSPVHGTQPADQ
eukprot:749015-Hanusia_phi.AAC.8